ncbi:hypothetical protein MNV49_001065 [Pseudohyphozyma bogoriensis]|nr:hypothetical protein MNV49_001065 [Pseudohyphozyma bogoriensis]
MSRSAINVTLGLMTFGAEGTPGARIHTAAELETVLDVFQQAGHSEVDTARGYAAGTSEELLGKIDWKKRGLIVDTKISPNTPGINHTIPILNKTIEVSLKALNADAVDIYYLHAPDHNTPYEETLKGVNELYKQGKFRRLGLSNYAAWEVAEIVGITERNGWVKPTVYQGVYNAVHRAVEPELFPALRKFGLAFYLYNPLAGGFFTGKYTSIDQAAPDGTRFDKTTSQGANYRQRYWNDSYFEALELVRPVAEKHGIPLAEVALRWVAHHSLLSKEKGDNVIIGASSLDHLKQNLEALEKGPLDEELVKVLDEAWFHVRAVVKPYFR